MTTHQLDYISENSNKLSEHDRIIGSYIYDDFDDLQSRIEGLLVESGTFLPRYAVTTLGGLLNIKGKTILIPIEICQFVDLGKVKAFWRKESLMDAPTPQDPKKVTMAEEELILSYFDLKPYWAAKRAQHEKKPGSKTSGPESRKLGN